MLPAGVVIRERLKKAKFSLFRLCGWIKAAQGNDLGMRVPPVGSGALKGEIQATDPMVVPPFHGLRRLGNSYFCSFAGGAIPADCTHYCRSDLR